MWQVEDRSRFLGIAAFGALGGGVAMLVQSVGYGYPLLVSTVFGAVTVGFAFFAALILGVPLYWLQSNNSPRSLWWLGVYLLIGLVGGVIFQVMFFGNSPMNLQAYDLALSLSYATIGAVSSVSAWVGTRYGKFQFRGSAT